VSAVNGRPCIVVTLSPTQCGVSYMTSIVIVHDWTGERRTVDVVSIEKASLVLRWPGQGLYTLCLVKNTVRAVSTNARRKNPHCLWHAGDIDKVREEVKSVFDPRKKEQDARHERHMREMPFQKGKGV
jgi:hypothetical protein